ncbi:hypothetical protein TNCT_504141 [Trichonephila clavata]|uniref:Uncharacterized protein n=1 Tax=Trichonephila clavata TaxID=2740835 RepID=A0A8X6I1F9_TRICU|nr:hypothetical protein TNCT_504141 [Trichonephila clavata]
MNSRKVSTVGSSYCHHINPWWTSQHDKQCCRPRSNNGPTRKMSSARKHIEKKKQKKAVGAALSLPGIGINGPSPYHKKRPSL